MVELQTYRDDIFILWPCCGLWFRERHNVQPAASLMIGWGFWGIEIRFLERPNSQIRHNNGQVQSKTK
jgi:hypothetical protein